MSFYYIRLEENYISKLHSMMAHILMSWFKVRTERRKTRIVKETEENADLHKVVLNKTMTTQEYCVKYDFVTPLMLNTIFLFKTQMSFADLLKH